MAGHRSRTPGRHGACTLARRDGYVSTVLAVVTVILTVLAIKYARDSSVAARDTVRPSQEMSRQPQAGTQQLRSLLDESKAAVEAARAGRIEDRSTPAEPRSRTRSDASMPSEAL